MATQVNDSNFDAVVLQSQLPVLVDFWAPWCAPCRMLAPIVEEVADNLYSTKVLILKPYDVADENTHLAKLYI